MDFLVHSTNCDPGVDSSAAGSGPRLGRLALIVGPDASSVESRLGFDLDPGVGSSARPVVTVQALGHDSFQPLTADLGEECLAGPDPLRRNRSSIMSAKEKIPLVTGGPQLLKAYGPTPPHPTLRSTVPTCPRPPPVARRWSCFPLLTAPLLPH